MLQHIYGTAWATKDELKDYLFRLEEAEKTRSPQAWQTAGFVPPARRAPGMVFWHPKGWALWQTIEQHMRKELDAAGYQEIKTPADYG